MISESTVKFLPPSVLCFLLNHVGLFVFLFCASIVNEAFERVASYGLMPNMIFYLMNNYRLEAANGSTILFLWSGMSNGLSIFGAFLSDSFMGRYLVISWDHSAAFL